MTLKVKKLNDLAIEPTFATEGSGCADLYAATSQDIWVEPSETVMIGTGLAFEIDEHCYGAIFARSGLASKQGLRPANCVGIIDSDYRGEVIIALHNDTKERQLVPAQSRIAQLAFLPCFLTEIKVVDELSDTERGENGFGSTGIK
jgi:dUTP pyrophosphatase